jgi:magnesium-transporting ATPase (P-type)
MNEMVFARCSINGVVYGAPLEADAADERADAAARAPRPPPSPRGGEDEAVPFDSTALRRAYAAGGAAAERIDEFMTIVATCHAALPVRADGRSSVAEGRKERPSDREWAEGELSFKAASPDEGALLLGAAEAGWACESALRQQLLVRVHGEPRGYEVLALNVFSATRKRMSVLLLEEATGRLLVCCKGADDTMLELVCTDDADAAAVATPPKRPAGGAARVGSGGGGGGGGDRRELHRAATLSHLLEFATTGLRTLVFAIGYPSEEEASRWLAQFHEASMAGEGREERLDAVAARLETGLRLVGVSAVEDRLQPGVPQTIEALQRGGIHIWMLTGARALLSWGVGGCAGLGRWVGLTGVRAHGGGEGRRSRQSALRARCVGCAS